MQRKEPTARRRTDTRPRTDAPTNEWGEELPRYQGTREAACPDCECRELEIWLSEGAVSALAVCPACETVHDLEGVRA